MNSRLGRVTKMIMMEKLLHVASHPRARMLLRPWTRFRVPVFMLHRMADPRRGIVGHDAEFLRSSLSYLKKHRYRFLSVEDVMNPQNTAADLADAVAFTLDDGYLDQAEIAAPVFAEFNCPVTIFLITGFVDGELWPWDEKVRFVLESTLLDDIEIDIGGAHCRFDLRVAAGVSRARRDIQFRCKRLSCAQMNDIATTLAKAAGVTLPESAPPKCLPLTWDMARDLEKTCVRFAPHCVSHYPVSQLDDEHAKEEISRSWQRINEELIRPLPIFCWPTGRFQDFGYRDINIARSTGITSAFSAVAQIANLAPSTLDSTKRYEVGRVGFPLRKMDVMRCASWIGMAEWIRHRSEWVDRYARLRAVPAYMMYRLFFRLGFYHGHMRIDWKKVERVVFVCAGNVCRSSYAEAVARQSGLNAVSAGLRVIERGPANSAAVTEAARRGVDLNDHVSRPFSSIEIRPSDLLFPMEPSQQRALDKLSMQRGAQTALLGLFCGVARPMIPDPYRSSSAYFRACFDWIDESVASIAAKKL